MCTWSIELFHRALMIDKLQNITHHANVSKCFDQNQKYFCWSKQREVYHDAYILGTLLAELVCVSVNSNWVHPPGISSKNCPGVEFDFWKLPGGREFDKCGDFVEIQSETFCPCIGFISD